MCKWGSLSTFAAACVAGAVQATEYNVPEDYTLDAAITAATDAADVILVAPGEYETTTQYGPNLKAKLIGLGATRDDVVISPKDNTYRTLRTGAGAWIENVTIVGNTNSSKVDKGGAIEMSGGTVTNCVIRDGRAYGNNNKHCGGNLYLNASSILVVDCVISGGQARKHGGNVCIDGGGTLRNCTIENGVSGIDSTTDEPRGANVYMYKGVVENCTIKDGTGAERAGNVYLGNEAASVSGSTISGGVTSGHGGNIFMTSGTISDCTITDGVCTSYEGGNIHMQGGTVIGCTITGGTAGTSGGNVRLNKGTLSDCTVSGGYAKGSDWTHGGGNIFVSPGRLTRCIVTEGRLNAGKNDGGGIRSRDAATIIEDCLVWNNANGGICLEGKGKHYNNTVVLNQESGYFGYGKDPGTFVNNVVYGNYKSADGSRNEWQGNKPAAADMYNCAFGDQKIGGQDIGIYANTFVLADDSCFKDAANGDFTLAANSALEDMGAVDSRTDASMKDLAGNSRSSGPIDIGCYERQKADMTVSMRYAQELPQLYAPATATFLATVESAPDPDAVSYEYDFGDGTAKVTTSDALVEHTYAEPGKYTVTIVARSGSAEATMTYDNFVMLGSKTVYVNPAATPAFPYGSPETGLQTLAAAVSEASEGADVLLVDGVYEQTAKIIVNKALRIRSQSGTPGSVVLRNTAEASASAGDRRVLAVDNAGAVISGLVIENGQVYHGNGGNLTVNAGMVSNCVIRGGVALADGSAEYGMGAAVALSGSGVVTHCIIADNEVRGTASGKWICGGAVVFPWGSAGKLSNCLIAGNRWVTGLVDASTAVNGGAGLVYHGSTAGSSVDNCTIVANVIDGFCGTDSAAGVRCDWNSAVRNSAIAGNVNVNGTDGADAVVSNVHLIFADDAWKDGLRACMTETALPSENETCHVAAKEEMFKNFAAGDYRPKTQGALFNKGIELATTPAVDLAGDPRVKFDAIDIGCYEGQRKLGFSLIVR